MHLRNISLLALTLLASLAKLPAAPPLQAQPPIELAGTSGEFGGLLVDASARRLLLAHPGNGSLDLVDLNSETLVRSLNLGEAQAIILDPARNRYQVTLGREKKLLSLDRNTLEKTAEVPLPGPGGALVLGPAGVNRTFVGKLRGSDLWVVDVDKKRLASTLGTAANGGQMAAEDETSRIYQAIKSDHTVLALSASDNNSTPSGAWPVEPATQPVALVLESRGDRRLFIAGGNGRLVALRSNDGKPLAEAAIRSGVEQLAYDAKKERLYCPSPTGQLTVMDTSFNQLKSLGEVPIPVGTKAAVVDPSSNALWIAYAAEGRCFVQKFTLP